MIKFTRYFLFFLFAATTFAEEVQLIRVTALSKTTLSLEFNLPVDIVTAENIENYSISHGTKVLSAFADDTVVTLDITEIKSGVSYIATYTPAQSQYFFSHGTSPQILQEPITRLPDFSYAGYYVGELPIPDIPIVANVLNFGAVADDGLDDSQAFNEAISQAGQGTIFIPAGRYVFDDILQMNKSGVVLRGEGSETVLEFRVSLYDIYPGENWQYNRGGMVWIGQPNGEDGVGETLTFVNSPSMLGDTFLFVSDTSQIQVGEYVLLIMEDDVSRSMYSHIQEGRGAIGDCNWQPVPLWHPVRVVGIDRNIIEIDHPLPFDVRVEWNPVITRYEAVEEVGLEDVVIQLPPRMMTDDHFGDGYNGIELSWVLNSWIRNVEIQNCDACLDFGLGTSFSTAKNITLSTGGEAEGQQLVRESHHGFTFSRSSNNLLTEFNIDISAVHAISMTHLAHQNVIRNGVGQDINFDHHRNAPFANLFSDINVGQGTNLYLSSGSICAGAYTGARETFWNIKSSEWDYPPPPIELSGLYINAIPARMEQIDVNGSWYEKIQYPSPSDLYLEQLQKRLGTLPEGFDVLQPMQVALRTNRYLSFNVPNLEVPVAFRVTVSGSNIAPVGSQKWIGPVQNGRAYLGCFSYFDNWDEQILVTGSDIVPSSSYLIESTMDGISFQAVETISTNKWGDVVGKVEDGIWTEENGIIDIMDMLAGVECFVSNPRSPSIAQCDLSPRVPDFRIDISDILMIVNGFAANPYPFVSEECR